MAGDRPAGSKDVQPRQRRNKTEKENKANAAPTKNKQAARTLGLQRLFGSSAPSAAGTAEVLQGAPVAAP